MVTTTNKNNSRTSNGAGTFNGKTNGVTPKSKSTGLPVPSNGNGIRRSAVSVEEQANALLERVRTTIVKKFGVKLQLREKRLQTKIGHAIKEKIGLDIAAQLKKRGKTMNWQRWNNEVFPTLFGQPDALRHDIETLALVMAKLYDVFELDPQEAIKSLVKFNQESLAKRNSYLQQEQSNNDDDIDDLEDDDDEEPEDLEDEEDDDFEEEDEDDEDEDDEDEDEEEEDLE
jgi:hypothetical protein